MHDQQITSSDRQLLAILDGLPIGVMLRAPDGTLLHINPAGERFVHRLGIGVAHIFDSPTAMLAHVEVVDEAGRPYQPTDLPVVNAIATGARRDATLGYRLPQGGWAWYHVQAEPLPLSDGTVGTVVTVDDVTDRRALEEELRVAAVTDPLTGLANRRSLAEHLILLQHRQRRGAGDVGLLYLDLDDFKGVNDTFGHDAGDRLLVQVARHLRSVTRDGDVVCRIGGDEFVVLATGDVAALADRLAAMVPPTVIAEGRPVRARLSAGWVLVGPDETLDRALGRADQVMYEVKRRRRDGGAVSGVGRR